MAQLLPPINFKKWIDEHRHVLRPPVGNKVVYQEFDDFIVMVVGGPNRRTDFHVNEGEEFFHQIEGDMVLRIIDQGKMREIPIRQGEIFLLPGGLPHSPQGPDESVGLVVEKKRLPNEKDGFQWYCDKCGAKIYEEFLYVENIVTQLPQVFDRFFNSSNSTCKICGTVHAQN